MILPNDILLRETSDGKTVWVSQQLVVERCGVSEGELRMTARKRYKTALPPSWREKAGGQEFYLGRIAGASWRWGRKNGQYYYDVDTIPNRQPTCYRDRLPSKEELIALVDEHRMRSSRERQASLTNLITQAAAEFYTEEDVRWLNGASGTEIGIATCRDYGKALAWCRFIAAIDRRQSYGAFGITTQYAFHETCAEILGRLKLANLRVSTGPSLRKKLRGFPSDVDEQRRWIISGKYGNVNRKIVGKYQIVDVTTGEIRRFDIHQAVMYNAYMNIGGPEKEWKETLYNETYVPMMEAFGVAPVALRTFNSHLARFSARLNADLHRHGADYYKKQMLTYTPAEKLTYAHSLFCGDGSGLVAYRYWKKVVKNGKAKEELRAMNVYAILISDVASGCITGYAFAPEGTHVETRQMVQDAVRMSVAAGGGQTMFELVSDNHGAFTQDEQKEFLREVFNVVRTIEPGNSQANPAETQFRLFKNSTLRSMKNFIRSSHSAKNIDAYANIEGMTTEDYPEYREAIAQTIRAIERWNNTPRGNGMTPTEMFRGNKHPECRPLPPIQLRNIFGHRTRVEVTRMRGFVDVEHAGINHKFTIPDYHNSGIRKIVRATGNGYDATVYVHWDETGADLYSSDGKYILSCAPTVKANNAHAERTPEQLAAQHFLNERKRAQIESAEAFALETQETFAIAVSNGYAADVQFGAGKEEINEWAEVEINTRLADNETRRAAVKGRTKQKRADERQERKEAKQLDDATLDYRKNKIVGNYFNHQ